MATVDEHIEEVRRLCHDPDGQYWSDPFLTNAVNQAIKQRDRVTGGNRSLLDLTLVAGTSLYSFSDLDDSNVFDVIGIAVEFNGYRVVCDQLSYTELVSSPGYRAMTTYRDVPRGFARYGASQIYLSPTPSQAYDTEWDCCVFSEDLEADDSDPLPYPYTEPVPYYAAYLCKTNQRQWAEGDTMKEEFYRLCSLIEGARVGLLPSAYGARR